VFLSLIIFFLSRPFFILLPQDPQRRPRKYTPFSEGPRGCVGMSLALMQARVALVALLTRFTFEVRAILFMEGGITRKCGTQLLSLFL
jgi:hypothetical protein